MCMRQVKIFPALTLIIILLLFIIYYIYNIDKGVLDVKVVYSFPVYENLNLTRHVSKLISNFRCSESHIKVLIIVTSHVADPYRRETIRMTWGKKLSTHVNNDFRTFFVVGKLTVNNTKLMKTLKEESDLYKDVIFGDFEEIFYHLPFKVEAGFEWAYKYCSFDYYLKIDDDVFVNLSNLFQILYHKNSIKTKLFLGRKHVEPSVARSGKYGVTYEEYGRWVYPDFCSGGGFVFSRDVVRKIIPYFQKTPFKLDDVYIGMLVKNAGFYPTHDDSFKFWETDCTYRNHYTAHHATHVTSRRHCINLLFNSMMMASNDTFIKIHYNDQI